MTHLTRDELRGWLDGRLEAERARVTAHLANCDRCGAVCAELLRGEIRGDPADHLQSAGFVRRGNDAYRPLLRRARWASPGWMATAAAVVAAAGLGTLWSLQGPARQPAGDLPPAIRGTTLQPLAPVGSVQRPLVFDWVSPVRASGFRIEILETGGETIYRTDIGEAPADLDETLADLLEEGVAYRWRVTALDRFGDPITVSTPSEFVLDGGLPAATTRPQ